MPNAINHALPVKPANWIVVAALLSQEFIIISTIINV